MIKVSEKQIVDLDGTVYTQDPDGLGWTGHPAPVEEEHVRRRSWDNDDR